MDKFKHLQAHSEYLISKKRKIITIERLVKTTQQQTRGMKIGLFELQDQNVGVISTKTSYLIKELLMNFLGTTTEL